MPQTRAVASITKYQATTKGLIYDGLKNFPSIRLLEWGDRIVVAENTTDAKFLTIFNLSDHRDTVNQELHNLCNELTVVTTTTPSN
jgi:hypothetical protein